MKISLKFAPMGPINNILALVQIMAWRRPGDKPLSESMVFKLVYRRIYASLGLNKLSHNELDNLRCIFVFDFFPYKPLCLSYDIVLIIINDISKFDLNKAVIWRIRSLIHVKG